MTCHYTPPSVTRNHRLEIRYFQLIVNIITGIPKYMERFILNHSLSITHKVIRILEKYLMKPLYKNSALFCEITMSLVSLVLREGFGRDCSVFKGTRDVQLPSLSTSRTVRAH